VTVCETVRPMLSDSCPVCLSVCHGCKVDVLWPNGWMDQDKTWQGGRPSPQPDCLRWGPSSTPSPQKRGHSKILAHVCCGQTAGWIKMSLGMERGLGPGDIVLHGHPAPPSKKRHSRSPPIFGPCLLCPYGCMDHDATWYGDRPRSRRHCVRWGPSFPRKRHSSSPAPIPIFGPCLLCPHRPSELRLSCVHTPSSFTPKFGNVRLELDR